jgi:23S rRNA maturation mini-RNase III
VYCPTPPPPPPPPQATCYRLLLSEGWPTGAESDLMRWAANSSSVAPPKHATRQQYKQATALEALVRRNVLFGGGCCWSS